MAKSNVPKKINPATLKPTPRQLAEGRAVGPRPLDAAAKVPFLIHLIIGAHMVTLFLIVLAMTPLTNNLDDIKQTIFHVVGPVHMLLALLAIALRQAPMPNPLVTAGLIGYGLVMLVSTLSSKFQWMGWDQILQNWSAAGMLLSAMCAGSYRKTADLFVRYMTILWLSVCLIGIFMFDLFSSGKHLSGVGWLFRLLYAGKEEYSNFFALLLTLNNADTQFQSTILNRDFMAGISLMFLPFGLLLALDPGPSRHAVAWRVLGAVSAFLTILSVFLCQSKGEYIVGTVIGVYMLAMFLSVGHFPGLRRRHILAGIGGVLIVLAAIGWMKSPTLLIQLKSLNTSVGSRSIMWNGAWQIFKDFPILGGGPGSYRVYFSSYRAPDYFLHEIANVTTYSHNYFLDLLAETGILGFLCFIVMLGAIWLRGLYYALRHPDGRMRMLMIACTASLLGIYGSNMSSPNARWIIGCSTLWTVMGFFVGALRQADGWKLAPKASAHPAAPARFTRPQLAVLGLAITIGVVALPISMAAGLNYFRSALDYANGLRYMEGGLREYSNASRQQTVARLLEESLGYFESAIKKDPTNVSAYYKVGSVYSTLSRIYEDYGVQAKAANNLKEARQAQAIADEYDASSKARYEKLDVLMPDYAEIHFNFGIVYDRYANFLRRKAAAIDVTKGPEEEARRVGLENEAKENDKKALEHLERMHQLSIKAEVYQMLGNQYQQFGLLDKSLETYREAVRRYPENDDLVRKYHDAAVIGNDSRSMVEALSLLWNNHPNDNAYLNRLIQTCVDGKLEPELEKSLQKLRGLNPLDPRIFAAEAARAQWQNKSAEVLREVDRYRKVGGRQAEVYQMGMTAAGALGNQQKLMEYQQALQEAGSTTAPAAREDNLRF